LYGCRESLIDGIKRATDRMIAGKVLWPLRRVARLRASFKAGGASSSPNRSYLRFAAAMKV